MILRTWHVETAVVASVLAVVTLATGARPVEWLGSLAVLAAFGHGSVASRLAEREALRPVPSVECHGQAVRYWIAKEALWAAYFLAHRSYAALVGCAVFALHPVWRRLWRRWHPLVPR